MLKWIKQTKFKFCPISSPYLKSHVFTLDKYHKSTKYHRRWLKAETDLIHRAALNKSDLRHGRKKLTCLCVFVWIWMSKRYRDWLSSLGCGESDSFWFYTFDCTFAGVRFKIVCAFTVILPFQRFFFSFCPYRLIYHYVSECLRLAGDLSAAETNEVKIRGERVYSQVISRYLYIYIYTYLTQQKIFLTKRFQLKFWIV